MNTGVPASDVISIGLAPSSLKWRANPKSASLICEEGGREGERERGERGMDREREGEREGGGKERERGRTRMRSFFVCDCLLDELQYTTATVYHSLRAHLAYHHLPGLLLPFDENVSRLQISVNDVVVAQRTHALGWRQKGSFSVATSALATPTHPAGRGRG